MVEEDLKINIEKSPKLEPHQEWICNYLDSLNENEKICSDGTLPSNLIRGALAAITNKNSNPDWMAQSAHSYREVWYGLGGQRDQDFYLRIKIGICSLLDKFGIKNKTVIKIINFQFKRQKIEKTLQILHEQKKAKIIADILYRTHLAFTKISHHFVYKDSKKEAIKIFNQLGIEVDQKDFPNPDNFNSLIQVFEGAIKEASLDPLKTHKEIDDFIKENKKDAPYLRLLFSLNYDAKRYYFSKANEFWLEWLWNENFLDEITKKAEDPTRYSYRMPELEYLAKVAEKVPVEVVRIIDSVRISEANFNPEVIARFLRIINDLPTEQIKTLTKKIHDENWVYLMRNFHQSSYEFDKIIKKLVEGKESDAILELSQAIFMLKSRAEVVEKGGRFSMEDPFYISNLDASGMFEAIADIEEGRTEKALQITTDIMAEIVKLSELDGTKVFEYDDPFSLFDVDFFTLEIKNVRGGSYREDVKNFTATIKKLIERTIGKKCGDVNEAKRLFSYIDKLPLCRSMWRLRLFVLAQCPEVFKDELKRAFFKLFEVGERYFDIEYGAEYHQMLIKGFGILDPSTEQREYVKKVFEYFGVILEDKDKEKWRNRDGVKILYFIKEYLTPEEKKDAEQLFKVSLDEVKYEPERMSDKIRSGSISSRSPVDLDKFTVEQIILNLKSEWTPQNLKERFKNDDFWSPRNVEGLGDAIKENVKKRTDDYLNSINAFFDRDKIHSQYLYSLLRGIEEMIRNKQSLNLDQIGKILGLFEVIKNSGKIEPFKRKDDKSWLADWIEIHKVITDILLYIVEDQDKEKRAKIHELYREQIKTVISYLFTIPDPLKEHEKPDYGGLYGIAINSVRGRAYEAFVAFIHNDGETLAEDVKELYRKALNDDSLAVRFVIGRYLATFYFRDNGFITNLFPDIFPKNIPDKKDVYLATWEGYLSNTLYNQLFPVLKDYYSYAITLDFKDYPQRKYPDGKGLDELLAIHLALAFAFLGLEIKDELFVQFWNKGNIARHREFISHLGRSCLVQAEAGNEWKKENGRTSKEKFISFWDWALNSNVVEKEALSGFGYWINIDLEVLPYNIVIEKIAETLEKSDGKIDWDYGLLRRLSVFAEKNGEKTLKIIRRFLLNSSGDLNSYRLAPILHGTEIKDALDIIYKNGSETLKQKIVDLINTLIEKGSSAFWGLKDIFKEN